MQRARSREVRALREQRHADETTDGAEEQIGLAVSAPVAAFASDRVHDQKFCIQTAIYFVCSKHSSMGRIAGQIRRDLIEFGVVHADYVESC